MMRKRPPFVGITKPYSMLLLGDGETVPYGLYHVGMARADQLCQLLGYSPKSITLVKARLKELVDHHYLREDWTPTRLVREPYHYTLDTKGIEYVRQAGIDGASAVRTSKETGTSYLFVKHALGVVDVVIAAAALTRAAPAYSLVRFIPERDLKQQPLKVRWQGASLSLVSDAFLEFRQALPDGHSRYMPLCIEHDGGTEQQQHFRRRIRAYISLLKSESYQEVFGVKSMTIAFTTFEGEKRRDQMREWTRAELAATNESSAIGIAFCFTRLVPPLDAKQLWLAPCWYTAYEADQPIALLGEG